MGIFFNLYGDRQANSIYSNKTSVARKHYRRILRILHHGILVYLYGVETTSFINEWLWKAWLQVICSTGGSWQGLMHCHPQSHRPRSRQLLVGTAWRGLTHPQPHEHELGRGQSGATMVVRRGAHQNIFTTYAIWNGLMWLCWID
jgi:hypothetical protein